MNTFTPVFELETLVHSLAHSGALKYNDGEFMQL